MTQLACDSDSSLIQMKDRPRLGLRDFHKEERLAVAADHPDELHHSLLVLVLIGAPQLPHDQISHVAHYELVGQVKLARFGIAEAPAHP